MRFRLITVLLLALNGILGASSSNQGIPAPAAPVIAKKPLVLAFYYPWYGTPEGPGGRAHGSKFIHWAGVDAIGMRITSSTHYPKGGAYDSHDPAVIERHCNLARSAGIDGFIISWWGKDSFEDQAVPACLDACKKAGTRACIFYEQIPKGGTPETVAAEITDIAKRFGAHAAYLSVIRDGVARPVIFVYGRAIQQLGVEKWKEVREILAHAAGPLPLLIGDDFSAKAVATFDGACAYGPAGDVAAAAKKKESVHTWAKRAMPWWANCGEGGEKARASGKISCATVFPGYDDTKVRTPGLLVERDGGKLYEELWRQAVAAKPDWVLVTSFNEWHEGSEIEPSEELGDKYIKMTAEWAAKFKAAQPNPN
ncbi:MAG: glycoside hydrolase family 99-like domain-containing protein [Planctomycetes bacterium]|nr:glycoside hydrolase family 99-like domain-containing protein [Planctomycetota bacterium]